MNIASLKEVVSAEEWQLRVDLAACYRLVAAYGWSDLIFTHITARIRGSRKTWMNSLISIWRMRSNITLASS